MDAEHDAASASPASPSIQEVAAQLEQVTLTSAARAFCALLWQRTLAVGTAWCDFDLAEFSAALGWTRAQRSNLRRTRDALVASRVIHFAPDPGVPGKGRISLNLEVSEWLPYDVRRRRRYQQATLVMFSGRSDANVTNHACSDSQNVTNPACSTAENVTNLARLTSPNVTNPAWLSRQNVTNVACSTDANMTNLASFPQDTPAAVIPDDAAPAPTTVAVTQDQLTQWHADLLEQRQQVAQLRQAWQAAVAAWEQCPPGTQRVTLHREANLADIAYREEEERLAVFERFLALIEGGRTKEEALAALQAPESPDPASSASEEVPEQSDGDLGLPEGGMAPDEPPVPVARLEGPELRKALFATLVRLFLGDAPDPTDVSLERGKYNRAIKGFMQKQVQPDDLVVLKATFERVWPKATCTALALANNLPFLMQKARELGYAFRAEDLRADV